MKRTSSRVFVVVGCVSSLALMVPLVLYAWQQRPGRQPTFAPSLDIVDEVAPVDLNDGGRAAAENERELRLDVQRLYAMASELKDQVNGNNSQVVLDVTLVRRVQAIEKLAKQIKDRTRR
jgi:hypothetical protein